MVYVQTANYSKNDSCVFFFGGGGGEGRVKQGRMTHGQSMWKWRMDLVIVPGIIVCWFCFCCVVLFFPLTLSSLGTSLTNMSFWSLRFICHIIQSKSSWFEKKGKATKLRHLQQWVEDILAGKVELKEPGTTEDTAQKGNNKETNKKEELWR